MTVSSTPPSGSSRSDTAKTGLMQDKKGLIMGVANDRSIGWGIAAAAAGQGAELAFTYQGDALKKRVNPLAESVGSDIVLPCDVTDEISVDLVFNTKKKNGANWIFLCMQLPILTRKS